MPHPRGSLPAGSDTKAAPEIAIRPGADAGKLPLELGKGRPVLLHFWATWCDACRDEFPKLKPTLLGLDARGMAVGLVSIDTPAVATAAQRYVEQWGLASLPSFLLDAPKPDPVAEAIGEQRWTGTLPATFLFDGKGKRVYSFIGQVSPRKLERAIKKVLRRHR